MVIQDPYLKHHQLYQFHCHHYLQLYLLRNQIVIINESSIFEQLQLNSYPQTFCTLPSFARIKRPRWRPVGLERLDDRHVRSHGKIGDCEQCTSRSAPAYFNSLKLKLMFLSSRLLSIVTSFYYFSYCC